MGLTNLRVSKKLWLVIASLMAAMLALAIGSQIFAQRNMDRALGEMSRLDKSVSTAIRWRGLTELSTSMIVTGALSSEPELTANLDQRVKEVIARINELQKEITTLLVSPEEKLAFDKVSADRTKVLALLAKVRELKASGDAAAAKNFVNTQFSPAIATYLATQDSFVKAEELERQNANAELEAGRRTVMVYTFSIAVLLFAVGMLVTAALVRSIVQPLRRAVGFADGIAAGDLTQEIHDPRRDEFGQLLQALDTMVQRLRGVVGEVRSGVESVSTASAEIAHGNQDLSARTEQAASSLQQTAASMEQLTSTVSQSTDTAHQARQLAGTAAQAATRGGEVMAEVVSSMEQISGSSRRIGDIIGTIDGIAFQTNILALNAAVEAARAGEQGRGFAVVASEVRSLAQRSAQAAREIKTLIGASVETVEVGSRQVAQAGQTMGEIVQGVRQVSDLIAEIHAASSEQRDGIGQVNQAVGHLDQMTQQNAALVEESAAAASSLRDQAQRLTDAISVFKLTSHAAPTPRMPAPSTTMTSLGVARTVAPTAVAAARSSSPAKPKAAVTPQLPNKPVSAKPAAKATGWTGASFGAATPDPKNDDWESF